MNKTGLLFHCLIQNHTMNEMRAILWMCFTLRICIKHIKIISNPTYSCHSLEYVLFSLTQRAFLIKTSVVLSFMFLSYLSVQKLESFYTVFHLNSFQQNIQLYPLVLEGLLLAHAWAFWSFELYSTLFFKLLNRFLLLLPPPTKSIRGRNKRFGFCLAKNLYCCCICVLL